MDDSGQVLDQFAEGQAQQFARIAKCNSGTTLH
jgi:hypothetical protein